MVITKCKKKEEEITENQEYRLQYLSQRRYAQQHVWMIELNQLTFHIFHLPMFRHQKPKIENHFREKKN